MVDLRSGGWGQKPEGLAKLAAPAQRCFKSVLPSQAEPGTCSNPLRVLTSIVWYCVVIVSYSAILHCKYQYIYIYIYIYTYIYIYICIIDYTLFQFRLWVSIHVYTHYACISMPLRTPQPQAPLRSGRGSANAPNTAVFSPNPQGSAFHEYLPCIDVFQKHPLHKHRPTGKWDN